MEVDQRVKRLEFQKQQPEIERARQHLLDFTRFTFPQYTVGKMHRLIAKELDKFLDAVIAKKSPRLIFCMPPRSGKSELVSRRFPAYALGRYPDLNFIAYRPRAIKSQPCLARTGTQHPRIRPAAFSGIAPACRCRGTADIE